MTEDWLKDYTVLMNREQVAVMSDDHSLTWAFELVYIYGDGDAHGNVENRCRRLQRSRKPQLAMALTQALQIEIYIPLFES